MDYKKYDNVFDNPPVYELKEMAARDLVTALKTLREQKTYTSAPQISNLIIEAVGEEAAREIAIYLPR